MKSPVFKCSAYIANIFVHGSFKAIRDSIANGNVPDYIEAFREPIGLMLKDGQKRTEVNSCILATLYMAPRMTVKTAHSIRAEVAAALCPKQVGVRVTYETWADDATLDRLIIQSL